MAGAGKLDRRIRFERESSGQDVLGGPVNDGWIPLNTVWASREDVNFAERFEGDERSATRVTRFVVRSSTLTRSILADDRIFHDKAFYEISGIKETKQGRNNMIEFSTIVRTDWAEDL